MIRILALETSCDETSAAVLEDGRHVLSNVISSQIPIHRRFGGVVPEIASRQHLEQVTSVVQEAMDNAGLGFPGLDAVAVTNGPGLVGALLVGVSTAKAMAYAMRKPLIAVHHLMGHVYANFLATPDLEFPLLCLVVSGGHTDLLLLAEHNRPRLLGSTRDDAAGEAFDKVARALGLPYPGGPALEVLAQNGDPRAHFFPRAYLEEGSLDFSFSGLKSAVINQLNRLRQAGKTGRDADIAASFQAAVVEILAYKTILAARQQGVSRVCLAGGVAANASLRQELASRADREGLIFHAPPGEFCTDNAAMIACAGYHQYTQGDRAGLDLNAVPDLPLPGYSQRSPGCGQCG